jgi:hypothetical protein
VPRSIRSLLTICAVALLAPAAATAGTIAPTEIDGSPLNIWVGGDGGIQANVDGYTRGEWYPYVSSDANGNEIPNPSARAGFGLITDPGGTNTQYFGKFISSSLPTPDSGPTLAAGNPATVTTVWTLKDFSGAPIVQLTQVVSYTNGQREADATYTVKNLTPSPLSFRANWAGDLAIRGSDIGIGFLTGSAPNRFMGGVNQEVGAAGGLVEKTPWSKYESNTLSQVGNHAVDVSPGGGFDNSLSTTSADNAAGVQWDDHDPRANGTALAPNAVATYTVGLKFIDTLGLTPPTDTKLTGQEQLLTAIAGDVNGNQVPNQTIHYTVTGANFLSGKVNTGSDGKATFSYIGGAPGTDTVTAFVDKNGNGMRDFDEPQAQSIISWQGPPPPVIGVSAGARPVSGTVKIKLPPGTSLGKAKALGLTGAATGFVKLTGAKSIPMGSTLDTSKGTVNLLSSASKSFSQSKFQSGNFNGGQFRVAQSTKNPLTQLSMGGGGLNSCSTRVPSGGSAARKRSRKLFGNAHGSFRTRGRNSSATVRGTKWTMTDTCAGTLTAVSKGVVIVRDFTLRKNKTVKAGHKYFAKAPKLKRKK